MDKFNNNECMILGFLVDRNEHLATIKSRVSLDDFYDAINRQIYSTILDMDRDRDEINQNTVSTRLASLHIMSFQEAYTYLETCIDLLPVYSAKIDTYINNLLDQSLKISFFEKIKAIGKDLQNGQIKDIGEYVALQDKHIHEIANRRRVSDFVSIDKIMPSVVETMYKRLDERKKKGYESYLSGFPSGFSALDKITGGFRKGELIVIGAYPSVGKTAFCLNLMHNIAKNPNRAVGFFSIEMSKESISKRLLSIASNLSTDALDQLDFKLQNGRLASVNGENQQTLRIAQSSIDNLAKMKIYIDDLSGIKILDLVQKAKKLKDKYKEELSAIFIDYLGLINNDSRLAQQSRAIQVGEIIKALKTLAKEIDVPVIVLSQLSRQAKKAQTSKPTFTKPGMSDLKDSSDIEATADIIMLLWREDYFTTQQGLGTEEEISASRDQSGANKADSKVELTIAKNRNYKTGQVSFLFMKDKSRFEVLVNDQGE